MQYHQLTISSQMLEFNLDEPYVLVMSMLGSDVKYFSLVLVFFICVLIWCGLSCMFTTAHWQNSET